MPSNRWMKRSNIPTAPVSRVAAFRGSCSRLFPPRPRASDDSRRFTSTVTTMTVRSSGVVMKWMNLAASGIESGGSNPEGSKVRVHQDEGDEGSGDYAGYAEQVLADVDGHLIPSGAAPDAFETILPQGVPARLWRRGMELEGHWGGYWFFPPG